MVDPGRLRALVDRLGHELAGLQELASLPTEELESNEDKRAVMRYRFIIAAEACIDMANHVIAAEGLRAPTTFADAFDVLGETDRIPADVASSMADFARFRNLLVHQYLDVDDTRVIEILHTRLKDIHAFRRAIAELAT